MMLWFRRGSAEARAALLQSRPSPSLYIMLWFRRGWQRLQTWFRTSPVPVLT